VAFKEKGREQHKWMEMLLGTTKQLQYSVMPKIQFMLFHKYKEKIITSG
jgi:hypothetical protein